MVRSLVLCGALVVCFCAGASDLGPAEYARVERAIRESARLEADLHVLCDGIGPRMAGTDGMRRALAWGRDAFAEAGLANIRFEAVPMPLLWTEGDTRVDLVSPVQSRVRAAASALSPSIPEALEAELVDGGTGKPGVISGRAASFQGKYVLVELDEVGSFDDLAVEQRDAVVALREAARARALAVLFVSTRPNRLLYRHVNSVSGRIDPIPSAVVAREDGLRLLRLVRGGEPVRIRLAMPNGIGEPYNTANVVAEVPGKDRPEEIVLLGAHLDSWDMGTGCLDNAVNAALVAHVARSIQATGVRPSRTLRFVLFGGEEFGLFGSLAYAKRHRAVLDRHVATIVHDMGDGPLVGYSVGGRDELLPRLEDLLGGEDGGAEYRHTREAYFLSDNFTFVLQGVPSLFAVQDTSGFFPTYHSEADTFDKINIDNVVNSAAVAGFVSLRIANSESRFGERLSQRQVTDWLRRAGMVRHLRFLGVWDSWRPMPDLGQGTRE